MILLESAGEGLLRAEFGVVNFVVCLIIVAFVFIQKFSSGGGGSGGGCGSGCGGCGGGCGG